MAESSLQSSLPNFSRTFDGTDETPPRLFDPAQAATTATAAAAAEDTLPGSHPKKLTSARTRGVPAEYHSPVKTAALKKKKPKKKPQPQEVEFCEHDPSQWDEDSSEVAFQGDDFEANGTQPDYAIDGGEEGDAGGEEEGRGADGIDEAEARAKRFALSSFGGFTKKSETSKPQGNSDDGARTGASAVRSTPKFQITLRGRTSARVDENPQQQEGEFQGGQEGEFDDEQDGYYDNDAEDNPEELDQDEANGAEEGQVGEGEELEEEPEQQQQEEREGDEFEEEEVYEMEENTVTL